MANSDQTSGFYAARPAILLNGLPQSSLSEGLMSLEVEETTAGLYRCEATFGNWGTLPGGKVGFVHTNRRVFDFGKTIAIKAGDKQTRGTIFNGRITGIEGRFPEDVPPQITILAEDRLQDLRMTRRTRSFEMMTDSAIIAQIASAPGLAPQIDLQGPTYPVITQVNQSDLAFLRERACAVDAEVWVDGQVLHAQARARRRQGDIELTYGAGLRAFTVLADTASQRTSLTVNGWDTDIKEGISFEAQEVAIVSELQGTQSGSGAVRKAFGVRGERLVHLVPFSLAEARYYAESHYRTMARQFVTGSARAEGDARLRVGARVKLEGIGPLFEGSYYVTSAKHVFNNDEGYSTEFTVEKPGFKL